MSTRRTPNATNRIVLISGTPPTGTAARILISPTNPVALGPYVPFKVAIPTATQNNQTEPVIVTNSNNVDDDSVKSSRPTTMPRQKKTPVLCRNCGTESRTVDRCSSCHRELRKCDVSESKIIIDKINETHNAVKGLQRGVSSKSFYSQQQNTSDFSRFVRAVNSSRMPQSRAQLKRAAVSRAAKSAASNECITISSDSEEETDSSDRQSSSSSKRQSSTQSVDSDSEQVTPTKKLKLDTSKDGSIAPTKLPGYNSDVTLNLVVKSLRLGQMKLTTVEVFRVTIDHIYGFVGCPHFDIARVLKIPWSSVTKCEICLEPSEACLYLTLSPGILPTLREQFKMVKGKWPYYDPQGSDDERYLMFYLDSDSLANSRQCNAAHLSHKIDCARKKYKKPKDFCQLMEYKESERRQNLSAACQLERENAKNEDMDVSRHQETEVTAADQTDSQALEVSAPRSSTEVVMFAGPREELFVYPPPPMKGGISVTNEDENCLNQGEFLNDVIIEFYLKYIYNEILSDKDRARSHIFSCFFYERLMQKGKRAVDENPAERRHSQVKKWTRKVDIFEKDFVFVPINEASHWYLAVICFPGLKQEQFESPNQSGNSSEEQKETPKKATGMISIKLPNFKVKRRPTTKTAEQQTVESSPEPTTHNPIKADEDQTTKLNPENQPNKTTTEQRTAESGPGPTIHSADTEEIANEDLTTTLQVNHQPNTKTTGQPTTKSSPQFATRQRQPNNTRITGGQTIEPDPQSSTQDPNEADQRQTSEPTDSITGQAEISITTLEDTAQNSCEDTPVQNCDSNLKDATAGDVTIEGNSSTSDSKSHTALTNQFSKELSNTDHGGELYSEIVAVQDSASYMNSVQPGERISALSPSTKSAQPATKSAIPLPWYGTKNHITQSSKSDKISSRNKAAVQDEESASHSTESTSHQNDNSSNNDKMVLFVTEQSGEFKLSDDLKRNLIISPAKSLKVHLTKISGLGPVWVSECKSTGNTTDSDSSSSPCNNPQKSTLITNAVHQNKRSSLTPVSKTDSMVGSSPTRQPTPEKCNIDPSSVDKVATPLEIMSTPTRKSRSSPRKSQTSPLKNHSPADRKIKTVESSHTQPIQNSAESQTAISDEQIAEDPEPSYKMLCHENVTIRPRKANCRVPHNDSIISQSVGQRFCESDSEIEVVRDSPTSGKTDRCFFIDVAAESSLDRSLDDSESAVSSNPSSLDIYKTSLLDGSRTCESEDRESQPLTPVTPIVTVNKQQQLKKLSADDESITLHRSPSVELVTDNHNCDVTVYDVIDDSHERLHTAAASLFQSDALSAIKSNYSESDGMQSSVTLVDDIIPRSIDEEEPDKCLSKQVSSYVTICHERAVENSTSGSSDPKRVYKRPCILIFDSLRGTTKSKIATSLREYLTMEWKTRKQDREGHRVFDKDTIKMCTVPVPQQNNYTDCGLFLLHYVEKFFSNPIKNFYLPIKGLENWFNPSECSTKRDEIKNIIRILQEDWIARRTNESS